MVLSLLSQKPIICILHQVAEEGGGIYFALPPLHYQKPIFMSVSITDESQGCLQTHAGLGTSPPFP